MSTGTYKPAAFKKHPTAYKKPRREAHFKNKPNEPYRPSERKGRWQGRLSRRECSIGAKCHIIRQLTRRLTVILMEDNYAGENNGGFPIRTVSRTSPAACIPL